MAQEIKRAAGGRRIVKQRALAQVSA